MFYTYILQSKSSGKFYIGHTENLEARLERHNKGLVTATKNKGEWVCVYFEMFDSKLEANRRELQIKKMKSRIYIENLISKKEKQTRPDL